MGKDGEIKTKPESIMIVCPNNHDSCALYKRILDAPSHHSISTL